MIDRMTVCPALVSSPMTKYAKNNISSSTTQECAHGALRDLGFIKDAFGSTLHASWGC